MKDYGENTPSASFTATVFLCKEATRLNEDVSAIILGKRVVVSPGRDPHIVYDEFGFYQPAHKPPLKA